LTCVRNHQPGSIRLRNHRPLAVTPSRETIMQKQSFPLIALSTSLLLLTSAALAETATEAPLNGPDRRVLPVPATFVIDGDGVIRAAFADVDYRQRMEPAAIIAALDQVGD
jgi:peroxiredoxin